MLLIERYVDLCYLVGYRQTLLLACCWYWHLDHCLLGLGFLLSLNQLLEVLSYDFGYLIVVLLILAFVNLQIEWIIEQINLFVTYLCYDIHRLVILINEHIDHLVGDFS